MTGKQTAQNQVVWWKDMKFLIGVVVVFLSIVLGFFGKGLSIIKFYEPFYLYTGLSIWAFSWLLLFLGIFMVGWETVKMIRSRIHYHVKETVRGTYRHTKVLPKKGIEKLKKIMNKDD